MNDRLPVESDAGDITALIQQWQSGNRQAADQLFERVYPELKRIAAAHLRNERLHHTLAPTALVNELYLKFIARCPVGVRGRAHFFALAAQALRHILVDYARLHNAKKRAANEFTVAFSAAGSAFAPRNEDLLAVNEALRQLQQLDARAAQVVELRFFRGLQEEEVAQLLGVSRITVQRDWRTARAWLMTRLRSGSSA